MSVTSRRKPRPHLTTSLPTVEFQSVLRIRPLKKAEKDDLIVLEPSQHTSSTNDSAVALLHPIIHMTSPEGKKNGHKSFERELGSPMFIKEGEEQQFHFDSILDTTTTQDKVHYSMGLNMARDAMEPLKHVGSTARNKGSNCNHLVVSMGVANTGKTYTSFGSQKAISRTSGKHSEDGLVLRILESLFSQSQHHIRDSNLSFAARITMLYVQSDQVYDMLTTPPEPQVNSSASKKSKSGVLAMVANFERGSSSDEGVKIGRNGMEELKIEQDSETHGFTANSTARTCRNVVEAREALQSGLKRGGGSGLIGGLVGKTIRGHTLVSVQPVLVKKRDGTVKHVGGTVTVLDMAGIERVKKSRSGGTAMRDSIAINSSVSAVMHCLRTIKHNNDVMSGESALQIVCHDDESLDGSDISNVSEQKAPKTHRNLKKVPYLQSKLTMLLQPVLSSTSAKTSVTMLLTAYPGPRDYAEKKSLLCDVELLRGANIATGAATKKQRTKSRKGGNSSTRPLMRANTGIQEDQDNSDNENNQDEANSVRLSRGKSGGSRSFHKMSPYKSSSLARHPSTLGAIEEIMPTIPTTPSAPTESFLGVDDVTAMPPPFAPTSHHQDSDFPACEMKSPQTRPPHSQSLYPVAATSPRIDHLPLSSPVIESYTASPNVHTPNEMMHSPPLSESLSSVPETKHTLASQCIAPSSATKHRSSATRATVAASPKIRPPSRPRQSPLVENKAIENASPNTTWMKDSPLKAFNKVVHASKKKGKVAMKKMEKIIVENSAFEGKAATENSLTTLSTQGNTPERTRSHALDKKKMRTSEKKTVDTTSENKESETILLRRLKDLEEQNARLFKQNVLLDEKCERLLSEKGKLAELLREARRHNRKADWTALDEEEFHNSRRLRLRDQQLIRSPLRQHLEAVDVTYDIHGRWVETGKTHFGLNFPSHWARAPDLDRRDRAIETEGTAAPPSTPTTPDKEKAFLAKRKVSKTSNEKRKIFNNFRAVVKENKKLKFDLTK